MGNRLTDEVETRIASPTTEIVYLGTEPGISRCLANHLELEQRLHPAPLCHLHNIIGTTTPSISPPLVVDHPSIQHAELHRLPPTGHSGSTCKHTSTRSRHSGRHSLHRGDRKAGPPWKFGLKYPTSLAKRILLYDDRLQSPELQLSQRRGGHLLLQTWRWGGSGNVPVRYQLVSPGDVLLSCGHVDAGFSDWIQSRWIASSFRLQRLSGCCVFTPRLHLRANRTLGNDEKRRHVSDSS